MILGGIVWSLTFLWLILSWRSGDFISHSEFMSENWISFAINFLSGIYVFLRGLSVTSRKFIVNCVGGIGTFTILLGYVLSQSDIVTNPDSPFYNSPVNVSFLGLSTGESFLALGILLVVIWIYGSKKKSVTEV